MKKKSLNKLIIIATFSPDTLQMIIYLANPEVTIQWLEQFTNNLPNPICWKQGIKFEFILNAFENVDIEKKCVKDETGLFYIGKFWSETEIVK